MDTHVDLLHEMQMEKHSLAYDLQEPSLLVDLVVITQIVSKFVTKGDFVRAENDNPGLLPINTRKVIGEANRWFNKTATDLLREQFGGSS